MADKTPKPEERNDEGFGTRLRRALGLPANLKEAQAQQHKYDWRDELATGMLFGYGPDLDKHIAAALYGRNVAEAVERAERIQQRDYREHHQGQALAANLAGNVASTAVGGELLGGAAKATGAAKYLEPAARVAGRLARGASPYLAGAGGAYGTIKGAETGSPVAAVEQGAEDAALGFIVPRHLAESAVGAGMGALQGSGEAGPGHRVEGAEQGALIGGVLGGGLSALAPVGGAMARGLDRMTGYRGSRMIQGAENAWRHLMQGEEPKRIVPGPERAAQRRLRAADRQETKPLSHEDIDRIQETRKHLGLPPAKGYQAAGEQVQSLGRVAGRKAKTEAQREVRENRVGLTDDMRTQGKMVAPHTENTVSEEISRIEEQQSNDAAAKYRAPYAEKVQLDDQTMNLLDNREMRSAMATAARVADARAFDNPEAVQQIADIHKLQRYFDDLEKYHADHAAWSERGGFDAPAMDKEQQTFISKIEDPAKRRQMLTQMGGKEVPEPQPPQPPEVSAGAIDRIRIAGQRRAESLKNVPGQEKKDTHDLGVAIEGRVQALNNYLDSLPNLQEARGNYRGYERRLKALREGEKMLGSDPRDFANWMNQLATGPDGQVDEALLSQIKQDMRVVLRDDMVGGVGKPREAVAGFDTLDVGKNYKGNVQTILGDEEAQRLFSASEQRLKDWTLAQEMGSRGSNTVDKLLDEQHAQSIYHGFMDPQGIPRQFMQDMFNSGNLMTKEEAQAMLHFLHGDPHELVRAIEEAPEGVLAQAVRLGIGRTVAGNQASQSQDVAAEDAAMDAQTGPLAPSWPPSAPSAPPASSSAANPYAQFSGPPAAPPASPAPPSKASPADFPEDGTLHVEVTDDRPSSTPSSRAPVPAGETNPYAQFDQARP